MINTQKKTLPTKVIVTFLSLILTLNYFTFNSKFYLQTRGCAMGTICAPSYANIFMEHFEKTHIYPLIENKTKLYLRYIDDIIMIWTGSENELFNFLNDLNKKHRSIKFDYKYSTKKIEFLDTQLYITEECKLETTLYRKPTDCQNYLHASSNHPYSLKKSIPYSQALRIKRICTSTEEYKTHCTALCQQLVEKRYNANLIKEQIERVDCLDRELLIIENKPKKVK